MLAPFARALGHKTAVIARHEAIFNCLFLTNTAKNPWKSVAPIYLINLRSFRKRIVLQVPVYTLHTVPMPFVSVKVVFKGQIPLKQSTIA